MQVSAAITRKSSSNLALAFILLPREKRSGMAALYAFCREVDDIADEDTIAPDERRRRLALWREDIRTACRQGSPELPVAQELVPVIHRYHLPFELFDELIRGVEMDLDICRYETYETLELYCYRVASVVGLLSIEIFGYRDQNCRTYAVHLGKALQLTNILRDVHRDALRGRIYLPLVELRRHQLTEQEILAGQYSTRFSNLASSVANEARRYYSLARRALPPVDRNAMATAELMGSVYWRLLAKLERRKFNVFGPNPTRLSRLQKALLIGRTWSGRAIGGWTPSYGLP